MSSPPFTQATARAYVQREMQDSTGKHFVDAFVNDVLNEGVQFAAKIAGLLRGSAVIDIVAGQPVYSLAGLSPRVLELLSVSLPSSSSSSMEFPLPLRSMEWLDRNRPTWRTDPASWPECYMRWDEGHDAIRLYPTPATSLSSQVIGGALVATSAYGILIGLGGISAAAATSAYGTTLGTSFKGGALRLNYIAAAVDLAADSDVLPIPTQYHWAAVHFACRRCCEWDVDIAQTNKVALYDAKVTAALDEAAALASSDFQTKPVRDTVVRYT